MKFKNLILACGLFLVVAAAGDWLTTRSYSSDKYFIRAEELAKRDVIFTEKFGPDATLYPVRKTMANRLPPQRSYVELRFWVKKERLSNSSEYLTIRLYRLPDGSEAGYELEVR